MRFSILLSLLLLASFGYSQENYALFRPGVQYVYDHPLPETAATSPLLGIQIEDVPCQFTYESLQTNAPENDEFCLVRVPAFIGSEICRDGGLTQLNLGSDESPIWLELRTAATVGTQWLAGLTPDSVFARVDDLYLGEVLGMADSIKAIGLYQKNETGQLIPLYEEAPLLVSQNYGLVRAVFLHWLGEDVGTIDLVGMSDPMVGLQNPTRTSVFDLTPGDELHWSSSISGMSQDGFFMVTNKRERATYEDRFWTSDNTLLNLVFSVDRITFFGGTPPPTTDTIYEASVLDTVRYDWEYLSFLDEQPGALIFDTTTTDIWRTVMLGYNYECERPAKQFSTEVKIYENCGQTSFEAITGDEFYRGLAGPYFAYSDVSGFNFRFRNVRYAALADGTICGEPLDFIVSTDSPLANDLISIWPNPAQDALFWSGPDQDKAMNLIITNTLGQQFPFGQVWPGQSIDVSSLQTGLYWILLRDFSGKYHHKTAFIKL